MKGRLLSIEEVLCCKTGTKFWVEDIKKVYPSAIYTLSLSQKKLYGGETPWQLFYWGPNSDTRRIKIYEWSEENMKTYKTSEMIAMLEVNPKLRFRCSQPIENGTEHTIAYIEEDGFIRMRTDEYGDDCLLSPKDDWTLVNPEPKPVTFDEAMKLFNDSKNVFCIYQGKRTNYSGKTKNTLSDGDRSPIGIWEILKGQWFVCEGEDEA